MKLFNKLTGKWDIRWRGAEDGAAVVSDSANPSGILRPRSISTTTGTLPTYAVSGIASWPQRVRGIKITGVRVLSGTLPSAANTDFTVRCAIDVPNDASGDSVSALLIPSAAPASSPVIELGQVRTFMVTPIWNGTSFAITVPPDGIQIDISSGINRLDLIHNIGTTLVLQWDIEAIEEI